MQDPFIRAANPEGPLEETIHSEPSAEQNELWSKINERWDAPAIERELKFLELPPDEQARLASIELSEDIARVAARIGVDEEKLALAMRYVSLKSLTIEEISQAVVGALGVSGEAKDSAERELKALFVPKQEPDSLPPVPGSIDSIKSAPIAPEPPKIETPPPPVPEATPEIKIPLEDKPFILHEESNPIFQEAPKNRPSVVFEPAVATRKVTPKPTTAKIEGSPRVVHYSEMRTSLDK